ncbi:unnamed protein product [Polarella glacialis]|uniref:Uncharacterized protein n=1 Tax=Polarella glacialis TaxID=89957 RepID=A0A813KZX3_POLGL|nr:unnamed protein product [Polarella glacialis]
MQDPSATLVQEIHSWVASTCSKGLAKQPPLGWLDRSFKLPVGTTEEHFRLFFRASKLPQSLELDFPKPGGLVHVILRAEAQREYEAAQTGGRTVTLPRRSPRIAGQSCAVSASSSLGEKPQSRASRGETSRRRGTSRIGGGPLFLRKVMLFCLLLVLTVFTVVCSSVIQAASQQTAAL